jgi:hypothetical protein
VLDINDVRRLGQLADTVRALRVPISVIDHHVAGDEPVGTLAVADTAACATGELVYDIAMTLGLEVTPAVAQSLYAAILTDTGSFRFSNTSPRAHGIAAALLAAGVNPEEMYRRIYAQVSLGRLQLLREALATLKSEPDIDGPFWDFMETKEEPKPEPPKDLEPAVRERFLSEGRILAQLRHPNLVAVTDVLFEYPERVGLVMEFVEGPFGPKSPDFFCSASGRRVASGLAACCTLGAQAAS